MNLPENLSPAATKIFQLLSSGSASQSAAQLSEKFTRPAGEEPKAIATANSLIVKGFVRKEEENGETIYFLLKSSAEAETKEDITGDGYVEGEGEANGDDTNAEEQRMIDLLEKNSKKLPEQELFKQYDKEQNPTNDEELNVNDDIENGLKELTGAGLIIQEGETYRIKS